MNNEERMSYVQIRVRNCEKKLKEHIKNYYSVIGDERTGMMILRRYVKPIDRIRSIESYTWHEYFEHEKFIFYFSKIATIISDEWSTLGSRFKNKGIERYDFQSYMNALNAGRTDADHYDPEDETTPDSWEIDELTMRKFQNAYDALIKAL